MTGRPRRRATSVTARPSCVLPHWPFGEYALSCIMWLPHDMHRSRETPTCIAHQNTRTSPWRLMLSPMQSKRARSSVGGTRAGFGVRSLTLWTCCTRLTSIRQVKLRRNPPTYAAIDDVLGMYHREPCICHVFVILDYAISFEHQFTVAPCIVLIRVLCRHIS